MCKYMTIPIYEYWRSLVRQVKLRIRALINILIFTELLPVAAQSLVHKLEITSDLTMTIQEDDESSTKIGI